MTLFGRFRRLKLDPAALGLARGEAHSTYFCTPAGAQIIGWAGTDGIHYCFIKSFGEMVFAVDPMNEPGNFVYPLAYNFEDFLRLLLACGSADLVQQAHAWDAARFEQEQQKNLPDAAGCAALAKLAQTFHLHPMEDPHGYLRTIYAEFDRSRIPFCPDYYEWVPVEPKKPVWRVYFGSAFWAQPSRSRSRAGRALSIRQSAHWEEDLVYIPALYRCAEGLVADLCIRVDPERISRFTDECRAAESQDAEQQTLLESRNPLHFSFRVQAELNRRVLRQKFACSMVWIPEPCLPEGDSNNLHARWLLEQYELDPSYGWAIHRVCLPWATSRAPEIRNLRLRLLPNPTVFPGGQWITQAVGDGTELTHPLSGAHYQLTVTEYEPQTLDPQAFPNSAMEYPSHCVAMSFTTEPPLPHRVIGLQDQNPGDRPRPKLASSSGLLPEIRSDASVIGIIGGADGPTALIFGGQRNEEIHSAVSSLHFEPQQAVCWRVTWLEQTRLPLELDCCPVATNNPFSDSQSPEID